MTRLTRIGIPLLLLIGLGAFVYVWFSAGGSKPKPEGLQSLAVGEMSLLRFDKANAPAPDNAFVGPQDDEVSFSDFEGRVVVVNYWATWCAPCVAEMPTLAELQTGYDPDKLIIIPISLDREGDYPQARRDLEQLTDGRLDFYTDPERGLIFASEIGGYPSTVIYSPDGAEIARYEGEADWVAPESKAFFNRIVSDWRL